MLPRIHIVYNETYDQNIHELVEKRHTKLAYAGGRLFASRLKKAIKPMLNRTLLAMEESTGLTWRWEHMRCYVAHDIPYDFDDPFTIKIRKSMQDAKETFFHELAHQLELQNKNRIIWRNPMAEKYAREPQDTREHILSHAILWKTYEKVYGKARLKRIINGYKLWPEHYRGWKIVEREGAENIMKAYIKPAPALHKLKHRIERRIEKRQIRKQEKKAGPVKLFGRRAK